MATWQALITTINYYKDMSVEDIKEFMEREEQLMREAQEGVLGIEICTDWHHPLVGDDGVIQCAACLAFFENDKAILNDLNRRLGEPYGAEELARLKRIKREVLNRTIKEEPTFFETVASNGRIKQRYFYE